MSGGDGYEPKYPTWDGDMNTFEAYRKRVELENLKGLVFMHQKSWTDGYYVWKSKQVMERMWTFYHSKVDR